MGCIARCRNPSHPLRPTIKSCRTRVGGAMDFDLRDKRVFVTAGASGIGRAIAVAFAEAGARVHVCDIDRSALDALAEPSAGITFDVCDVSDSAAVERTITSALAQ